MSSQLLQRVLFLLKYIDSYISIFFSMFVSILSRIKKYMIVTICDEVVNNFMLDNVALIHLIYFLIGNESITRNWIGTPYDVSLCSWYVSLQTSHQ